MTDERVREGVAIWVAVILGACGSGAGSGDADASQAGDPDAAIATDAQEEPTEPFRAGNNQISVHNGAQLTVQFRAGTEGPGTCLFEMVAGCELQTCELDGPTPFPDAGAITVTSPAGEIMLAPDADGRYSGGGGASWEVGDEIQVAAAGADVPAFDQTLIGPGNVESVVAPDLNAPFVVRRDEPFPVTWTGADERVTLAINCRLPDMPTVQMRCIFDDGSLSDTAPVDALARLPACESPYVGFYLFTEHRRHVEPGDGSMVKVSARGTIHTAPAMVTIE